MLFQYCDIISCRFVALSSYITLLGKVWLAKWCKIQEPFVCIHIIHIHHLYFHSRTKSSTFKITKYMWMYRNVSSLYASRL